MTTRRNMMNRVKGFKVGFYIRVSTEEQASFKNPEGSIKNQTERLKQFLQYKNSAENFGELVHTFVDEGLSAKNTKRPGLQNLLSAIRRKEVDLVIVSELSRISRNLRDFCEIWDFMKQMKCGFLSLRENADSTTASGEMVIFSIANIAQYERRQTSERVQANMIARSKRGLYNGGAVPIGYKLAEKKGYLDVDTKYAPVIKAAFDEFIKLESLSIAAKSLNEKGCRITRLTQGGSRLKRLDYFTVSNLQHILRNKTYMGIKTYKEYGATHETKAKWEGIVTKANFNKAQKILDRNFRRRKPKNKSNFYPYLLSGITFCRECNQHLSGKSAHGKTKKIGYYEHSWTTKRNSTLSSAVLKHEPHRVPAAKLEPIVIKALKNLFSNEQIAKKLFEKAKLSSKSNSKQKEALSLKSKLHGYESQLESLAERLSELPKDVPAKPIFERMKKIEKLKIQASKQLENLKVSSREQEKAADFEDYKTYSEKVIKLLENEKKTEMVLKIIKKFVKKIEVGVDSVRIHFYIGQRWLAEELVSANSSFSSLKKFGNFESSNTLVNGGTRKT